METQPDKRWRTWRRCLVGLGVMVTLLGLFYTEELWRGKAAWEKGQRAVEAAGTDLNWEHHLPPPVPDAENVFGIPEMQQWFTGRGATELSKKLPFPGSGRTNRLTVAELTIGLPGSSAPADAVVLRADDPALVTKAAKLLQEALGPGLVSPADVEILLRRPEEVRPARIFLLCQTNPTPNELRKFFPDSMVESAMSGSRDPLQFEPAGSGSYRVTMPATVVAADFLGLCQPLEADFLLIHDALQRRYSRMAGNYADAGQVPVPNFVTVRSFAQTLGARAQCHLLLGQPEEALRDVALIHDSRRIMEGCQPMTLVAAMIDVAVTGLEVQVIADGLRRRAWREPQLAALQELLGQIHLLAPVHQAMEMQPVFLSRSLANLSNQRLVELLFDDRKVDPWEARKRTILAELVPRGWVYQNFAGCLNLYPGFIASINPAGEVAYPDKEKAAGQAISGVFARRSPYNFIAAEWVPNFTRANQTTARNQTLANEAMAACALERCHLARGEFPETLQALIPQFIDQVPRDVIGGQPLHYRRAADGTFILYSVGWNGVDDGGAPGDGIGTGDWVWPVVAY